MDTISGIRDLQIHTAQHLILLHGSWSLEAEDREKNVMGKGNDQKVGVKAVSKLWSL